MLNHEKYMNKLLKTDDDMCGFTKKYIHPDAGVCSCNAISCNVCTALKSIWLMQEYKEPEVDWSKIKVDTPILVRESLDEPLHRRYFAKYEDEKVYAWEVGATSWTAEGRSESWEYAELIEVENE